MRFFKRMPSPGLVIACIALIVALTGTSYAAVKLAPRNSVGTAALRNNAVISSKVKDRSLLARDFARGQIPAGPAGAPGAAGAAGARGPTGPAGPAGAGNWVIADPAGTIIHSAGIVAVSHAGVGIYDVTFNRDVSGCAYVATPGANTAGTTIFGRIADWNRTATNTVVRVTTSTGAVATDSAFSAAAFC
jgi:hypothetical protein